jgi:hypothetical protein
MTNKNSSFVVNTLSLSKQLVSSHHWVWKKGMRTNAGIIIDIIDPQSDLMMFDDIAKQICFKNPQEESVLPDLEDRGTKLLILNQIRSRRGDWDWKPIPLYHDPIPDWVIEKPSAERQTLYGSYISALVSAFLKK